MNFIVMKHCMEMVPPPFVFPHKPSHSPKLETIREDDEEEDDLVITDLNVEMFFHFLCMSLFRATKKLLQSPPWRRWEMLGKIFTSQF